jgi:hypothetical protein
MFGKLLTNIKQLDLENRVGNPEFQGGGPGGGGQTFEVYKQKSKNAQLSGVVFTTLHFLRNLRIGPIRWSVTLQ